MARKDEGLVGRKFGRLMVAECLGHKDGKKRNPILYRCVCDCGNESIVRGYALLDGNPRSCGCLQKEIVGELARRNKYGYKHGGCPKGTLKGKPYLSWQAMMTRCYNENDPGFLEYGAKGITVCDRWRHSFEAFYEDMGDRPKGTTIDRIDSNGNYEPSNCRWAKPKTQSRNRPSFNKMLTCNGETRCVSEWAEILGIPCQRIFSRLKMGWTNIEDILTKPSSKNILGRVRNNLKLS